MDLARLARLFSGLRPMGLSTLQHFDPLGAKWAGGREGPAWLRAAGLTRACSSSSSQPPLGQGNQENTSSLSSDLSQPSPTAAQEEEEESFGTLSNKYSSRRMFRKSTAQLYNLRLREQSAEDEERELEPKSWQGRRDTPYWYFFQCKRLIKEGKVREPLDSVAPSSTSPEAQYFGGGHLTFLISKYLDAQGSSVFTHPGCCTGQSNSPLAFAPPPPIAVLMFVSPAQPSQLQLPHQLPYAHAHRPESLVLSLVFPAVSSSH